MRSRQYQPGPWTQLAITAADLTDRIFPLPTDTFGQVFCAALFLFNLCMVSYIIHGVSKHL